MQLSYDQNPLPGFRGMLAENFSQRQVDSKLAEAAVAYGDAVMAGTDKERQVEILAADIANFTGIAVAATTEVTKVDGSTPLYEDKSSLPVMVRGRIWAVAGGAVTVNAEVVPSLGAATKFTAGTGTSKTKAYARTAAAADGDLIIIELVGP